MSSFTFKTPNGESFEIKMPDGATAEQALAVFKQQVDTGGLVGFKIGDAVNAATQAAAGLSSAAATATQGIASALSKLPGGTNLNSLTDSIGAMGVGAPNQVTSALLGAGPGIISAGNSLLKSLGASQISSVISGPLTGPVAQAGSLPNNAINSISGALAGTPLNGIDAADFAKQGPSLGAIGDLSKAMVTGVMAQASKLLGQGPGDLTSALGLGKFGFDAKQLETAGFLKPGTASSFLKSGEMDLTSVLNSPLPWTGKDGIKGVEDLLGNGKMQDKIQQGLMSSGLDAIKQLGVPVDKLSPSALGGVATLAAKSPEGAAAALTAPGGIAAAAGGAVGALAGLVGSGVTGLTDKIKDVMSNSAFAVKLTNGKIEPPLKQEEAAPAATNTVNSDTVDAAGARIIGNDKVPDVTATKMTT